MHARDGGGEESESARKSDDERMKEKEGERNYVGVRKEKERATDRDIERVTGVRRGCGERSFGTGCKFRSYSLVVHSGVVGGSGGCRDANERIKG